MIPMLHSSRSCNVVLLLQLLLLSSLSIVPTMINAYTIIHRRAPSIILSTTPPPISTIRRNVYSHKYRHHQHQQSKLYSTTNDVTTNIEHENDTTSTDTDTSTEDVQEQKIQQQYLNPAVYTIQPSKTVTIFSMVKDMELSLNRTITSLCVGEPDFLPPTNVIQSIQQQSTIINTDTNTSNNQNIIDATKYTAVSGVYELRKAISNDIQQRKNVYYNPITDIVVSNGAKQSVYQSIWAMAGQNDIVLIPSPYWPSYPEQVRLTGAIPIIIPTTIDTGYRLTPSVLQQTIEQYNDQNQNQIKVLILCNPCNPTGIVYNRNELQNLCNVLYHYPNITVIADEIYERLVYTDENDNDNDHHVSIASIPNMYHRTIIINGFSKSYAMTGLRIGYSCAPTHISKAITTIQSQLTSCANAISQYAAISALQHTDPQWIVNVLNIMKMKRNYVLQRINTLPNIDPIDQNSLYQPNGAFYILLDISKYCTILPSSNDTNNKIEYDDITFCINLLQQNELAIVPGSAFGISGTVRLSYATSMETLIIAMDKLQKYLYTIQQEQEKEKKQPKKKNNNEFFLYK